MDFKIYLNIRKYAHYNTKHDLKKTYKNNGYRSFHKAGLIRGEFLGLYMKNCIYNCNYSLSPSAV